MTTYITLLDEVFSLARLTPAEFRLVTTLPRLADAQREGGTEAERADRYASDARQLLRRNYPIASDYDAMMRTVVGAVYRDQAYRLLADAKGDDRGAFVARLRHNPGRLVLDAYLQGWDSQRALSDRSTLGPAQISRILKYSLNDADVKNPTVALHTLSKAFEKLGVVPIYSSVPNSVAAGGAFQPRSTPMTLREAQLVGLAGAATRCLMVLGPTRDAHAAVTGLLGRNLCNWFGTWDESSLDDSVNWFLRATTAEPWLVQPFQWAAAEQRAAQRRSAGPLLASDEEAAILRDALRTGPATWFAADPDEEAKGETDAWAAEWLRATTRSTDNWLNSSRFASTVETLFAAATKDAGPAPSYPGFPDVGLYLTPNWAVWEEQEPLEFGHRRVSEKNQRHRVLKARTGESEREVHVLCDGREPFRAHLGYSAGGQVRWSAAWGRDQLCLRAVVMRDVGDHYAPELVRCSIASGDPAKPATSWLLLHRVEHSRPDGTCLFSGPKLRDGAAVPSADPVKRAKQLRESRPFQVRPIVTAKVTYEEVLRDRALRTELYGLTQQLFETGLWDGRPCDESVRNGWHGWVLGLSKAAATGRDRHVADACRQWLDDIDRYHPEQNGGRVLRAYHRFVYDVSARLRDRIHIRVRQLLAGLMEFFRAPYGWIFPLGATSRDEPKEPYYKAASPLNAESIKWVLAQEQNSIVGHVARTNEPYLCPDSDACPYYWRYWSGDPAAKPRRVSALAVPLSDPRGGPNPLGVLILERDHPHAFTAAQLIDLRARAKELSTNLLLLERLERREGVPWHPGFDEFNGDNNSWHLVDFFEQMCGRLADAIDDVRAVCTVWYVDKECDSVFVLASTGYVQSYRYTALPYKGSPFEQVAEHNGPRIFDEGEIENIAPGLIERGFTRLVVAPLAAPDSRRVQALISVGVASNNPKADRPPPAPSEAHQPKREHVLPAALELEELGRALWKAADVFLSDRNAVLKAWMVDRATVAGEQPPRVQFQVAAQLIEEVMQLRRVFVWVREPEPTGPGDAPEYTLVAFRSSVMIDPNRDAGKLEFTKAFTHWPAFGRWLDGVQSSTPENLRRDADPKTKEVFTRTYNALDLFARTRREPRNKAANPAANCLLDLTLGKAHEDEESPQSEARNPVSRPPAVEQERAMIYEAGVDENGFPDLIVYIGRPIDRRPITGFSRELLSAFGEHCHRLYRDWATERRFVNATSNGQWLPEGRPIPTVPALTALMVDESRNLQTSPALAGHSDGTEAVRLVTRTGSGAAQQYAILAAQPYGSRVDQNRDVCSLVGPDVFSDVPVGAVGTPPTRLPNGEVLVRDGELRLGIESFSGLDPVYAELIVSCPKSFTDGSGDEEELVGSMVRAGRRIECLYSRDYAGLAGGAFALPDGAAPPTVDEARAELGHRLAVALGPLGKGWTGTVTYAPPEGEQKWSAVRPQDLAQYGVVCDVPPGKARVGRLAVPLKIAGRDYGWLSAGWTEPLRRPFFRASAAGPPADRLAAKVRQDPMPSGGTDENEARQTWGDEWAAVRRYVGFVVGCWNALTWHLVPTAGAVRVAPPKAGQVRSYPVLLLPREPQPVPRDATTGGTGPYPPRTGHR